jgi:sugar O-acyltransferase (sialic acid O-acetyltransferase NeuD family)
MMAVVVVGGGGHAKVVLSALLGAGTYHVVGYTDAADAGEPLFGVPRLGDDTALERFAAGHPGAAAAIGAGMVGSTTIRRRIEAHAESLGLTLVVVRAATAVINPDVVLGPGTFVADGVVVNPCARIGRCAILNTGCIVEHDVVVGDHAHVSPGAIVCGNAWIGENAWIGAGAVVTQGVRVPPGSIVGAGAVVIGDLPEPGTYVGIPARRHT